MPYIILTQCAPCPKQRAFYIDKLNCDESFTQIDLMGEKEKTPSTLATPLSSPGHAGQTFMQISYRQKMIKLTKINWITA